MANSTATIREIRCYVAVEAGGDSPIGVQGWHHKTFPASLAVIDILLSSEFRDYLLWPLDAPMR